MKATQFRIGNLVSLNGKEFEVTLQSLYEGANLDWKPIHITKEILLRCGFKECELGGLSIETDEYEYIEFNSVLFCWVNGTKKPIKYVHQLQNLYFALTQKELRVRDDVNAQRVLITDLDISVRLLNCLKNEMSFDYYKYGGLGITYLDEVSNYTKKEVYRVRHLGGKSMTELEDLMLKFNVKFKEK
jgi:hypothetical protein